MGMDKSLRWNFTKYVTLNMLGQMAYSFYTAADTFFVSAALGLMGLPPSISPFRFSALSAA